MCETCGCGLKGHHHDHDHGHRHDGAKGEAIEIMQNILHENDHNAAHNREHFERHGVLAVNIMSSPGSGKTRLLEATIDALKGRYRIGVVEGDLETENDAARIRAKGVPAVQITTGTACHLDARLVHDALHDMNLDELDIVFIENVGNLVCPAAFDLGQHANVVLLSVTEGDDKPAKYPVMFHEADLVGITKTDFLDFIDDFSVEKATACIRNLATRADILQLSAKRPETLGPWVEWLEKRLAGVRGSERKTA
ncbi:MAG: hydrogenase accessory protein HypB [Alphaproteobacteria bacterium]|nr:hydrogenase accessory protein HypB [Alphaproteobacteria bacterium]